ncbi:MAG: DUF3570 domain-containing protein [Polyangiales bacterium]
MVSSGIGWSRVICGCWVVVVALASAASAQEVANAVYVRSDSNQTVVVAPRVRVQAPVSEATRVSAIYAADVWTSASIDIMASASKKPVTEQRDELDVSVDHAWEDVTLTAAYRLSIEPDYVSHGGSGGFSYDFAQNNSTLAVGVSGSADRVGRAGDPQFSRDAGTLGARVSFTQVLGVGTLVQLMYEWSRGSGYQASPYRYVAIGQGGACTVTSGAGAPSALCVPETTPGKRLRHAFGLELRHALSEVVSLRLAYRLYADDWGVLSHTARGELAWALDPDTILAARFRFYTQRAADFYRSYYAQPAVYVTRDKELSPLSSSRAGLELDRAWQLAGGHVLTSTVSVGAIYYDYRDFPLLDHIVALEINAGLVFAL